MLTTAIKPNTYQDSVSLMLLSQQLTALTGVNKVSVMMGTPANRDILRATGFGSPELDSAHFWRETPLTRTWPRSELASVLSAVPLEAGCSATCSSDG